MPLLIPRWGSTRGWASPSEDWIPWSFSTGDHHFVMLPRCYHRLIQYQSIYDHIYIYIYYIIYIHYIYIQYNYTLSWCVPFSIAILEVFFDQGISPLRGKPPFSFHPQVAVEESLRWEKRKLSSNVLRSRRAGRSSAGGHPSTKRLMNWYPLVNVDIANWKITMLFLWVNPLFRLGHVQ